MAGRTHLPATRDRAGAGISQAFEERRGHRQQCRLFLAWLRGVFTRTNARRALRRFALHPEQDFQQNGSSGFPHRPAVGPAGEHALLRFGALGARPFRSHGWRCSLCAASPLPGNEKGRDYSRSLTGTGMPLKNAFSTPNDGRASAPLEVRGNFPFRKGQRLKTQIDFKYCVLHSIRSLTDSENLG